MSEVFGHKYELYIRKPLELIQVHQESTGYEGNVVALASPTSQVVGVTRTSPIVSVGNGGVLDSSGYSDYLTVDTGSVVIKNPIQMEANITYINNGSNKSAPPATIKLYNLSKTTIQGIQKDCLLMLKAGYESDASLPIVFVGVVEKVSTQRDDSSIVTTIVCKEGGNTLKSKTITKTWEKGTLILSAFITMMDEFEKVGIPSGGFFGNAGTLQTFPDTTQLSGTLGKVLDELCAMLPNISQMCWYISGGKLFIQPKYDDRYVDTINLEPSQVIGTISIDDDNLGEDTSKTQNMQAGVKFTCYLNGRIRLENRVVVGYGDYMGTYKPTGIVYNLNWKNGPWQMSVETKAFNGTDDRSSV